MFVKDSTKQIIISSALSGKVIDVIPFDLYTIETVDNMLRDIIDTFIFEDEEGLLIKIGNML